MTIRLRTYSYQLKLDGDSASIEIGREKIEARKGTELYRIIEAYFDGNSSSGGEAAFRHLIRLGVTKLEEKGNG